VELGSKTCHRKSFPGIGEEGFSKNDPHRQFVGGPAAKMQLERKNGVLYTDAGGKGSI